MEAAFSSLGACTADESTPIHSREVHPAKQTSEESSEDCNQSHYEGILTMVTGSANGRALCIEMYVRNLVLIMYAAPSTSGEIGGRVW